MPSPIGQVAVDGALWRARMRDLEEGGAPMAVGSAVVIESIDIQIVQGVQPVSL